jgi:tight adherence protein C
MGSLETTPVVSILVFLATSAVVVFALLRLDRTNRRARARLRELAEGEARPPSSVSVSGIALSALPAVGNLFMPAEGRQRVQLQTRLTRAGIYDSRAPGVFLGIKLLLIVVLAILGALAPSLWGVSSGRPVLVAGLVGAGCGLILPGLWLDSRIRARQTVLRRGLPDALDMMVLCVEGGISVPGALERVTSELQMAHPLLAGELTIVFREVQLGQSVGEAMRRLSDRCGLEEIRYLASVFLQTERYGASVAKALRIHADTCRQERQQQAEERAQKAAVQILLPTLLCIFPAIFIVILGPAAFQIATLFAKK